MKQRGVHKDSIELTLFSYELGIDYNNRISLDMETYLSEEELEKLIRQIKTGKLKIILEQ